ncbi:MAG: dephospho-CoA kinase [Nitrospirae bacterium]|nr:dephospho-CoA kinase [Nitrospirota bacterium]
MVEFGLTGGIASGKSTVSAMFRELGAHVIDADLLAREALAPGSPALHDVARIFGEAAILPDGNLDRKAVADVVFRDAVRRAELEAVVHPFVFREEARLVADIYKKDPHAVVIFDAALLIESGAQARMDGVVLVSCSASTQMDRLVRLMGMTPEDAVLRVNAQMPLVEKRGYATYIVDNDGSLDETRAQVREIYRKLASTA